jgi:hypothetical protein
MASTSYQRGRAAEYRVMDEAALDGWLAARCAGSHGAFDVLIWCADRLRFIQVKTFITRPGSYKKDLEQLATMVLPPHATSELWIRQKGAREWHKQITVQEGHECPRLLVPAS